MPLRQTVALLALLLLAACGSGRGSSRPANIPQPEMDVRLAHDVFFGSRSEAPATIDVMVTNRAAVPITVRRVEVSSPGMSSWTIRSRQQEFREVVDPGATKQVTLFTTARTSTRRPTEPLTLRAIIYLEGAGASWREVLLAR